MKIRVDAPASDARRERIEGAVLAQVSALRAAERADAAVPSARRWWWSAAAACAVAAAAVVAWVMLRGGDERAPVEIAAPSRVVTPVGGTSRFTVGDAVIDAGSDTSVEVFARDADGGVTLVLARGSVDCDVAPRAGRAPCRVLAGDVTVEVVGTRFTVARRPAVRVDVARGKVRVAEHGNTWFVAEGESWPAGELAEEKASGLGPQASGSGSEAEAVELDPQPGPKPPPKQHYADTSKEQVALIDQAHALEDKDPNAALRMYREYERRFPNGAMAEDAAWEPVMILRSQHRDDEVRKEAAAYLRKYPQGTYAAIAKQFVARP